MEPTGDSIDNIGTKDTVGDSEVLGDGIDKASSNSSLIACARSIEVTESCSHTVIKKVSDHSSYRWCCLPSVAGLTEWQVDILFATSSFHFAVGITSSSEDVEGDYNTVFPGSRRHRCILYWTNGCILTKKEANAGAPTKDFHNGHLPYKTGDELKFVLDQYENTFTIYFGEQEVKRVTGIGDTPFSASTWHPCAVLYAQDEHLKFACDALFVVCISLADKLECEGVRHSYTFICTSLSGEELANLCLGATASMKELRSAIADATGRLNFTLLSADSGEDANLAHGDASVSLVFGGG